MHIPSLILSFFALLVPSFGNSSATILPQMQDGIAATTTLAENAPAPQVAVPARLVIPAIKLDVRVLGVGVNALGQMDVPAAASGSVGWYEFGTVPGEIGSAVIDAHVFADFAGLNKLKKGDDIDIVTHSGNTLHFVVSAVKEYALKDLSPEELFTPTTEHALNLITCAGNLTADGSTYDHRLIVYTTLVG